MTQLYWIGPDYEGTAGVVPLPEGWPANDHEDNEPWRVDEKLAYRLGDKGQGDAVYSLGKPKPAKAETPAKADGAP